MIQKQVEIPVLDKGFIIFLESLGSDQTIVDAARVSYGKGTKKKSTNPGLIKYLITHNHMTPLEMTEFMFQIKAPLFVARQWFRHRIGEFNEMSLRYSECPDDFYFPEKWRAQHDKNKQASGDILPAYKAESCDRTLRQHTQNAIAAYNDLILCGASREMARMVLPVNLYTTWYWKVNGRSLANFISLRNSPDAQPEIQEYAKILEICMEDVCPLALNELRKKFQPIQNRHGVK